MRLPKPNVDEIKYYDLRKKWRKVERHLDNPRVAMKQLARERACLWGTSWPVTMTGNNRAISNTGSVT
jgi:hypothetical protein